jgi:hypothetical protein
VNTIHDLPETPAFRAVQPDSPISEIALRVVLEFDGWNLYVLGTATLIAGNLAITARHVVESVLRKFGRKQNADENSEIDACAIRLYQVLPGPEYRVWEVRSVWVCPTDIAILHLALWKTTLPEETIYWKSTRLRALPPPIDQKVVAFGYRESKVSVKEDSEGTHHIELNDQPTVSIGTIKQIYPSGRDRVLLPFPCYEIEARFDPGMSGGMVIDENGALCGLICASLQTSDPTAPPISYVVTLWPMFTTVISANRGECYPKDVKYPMIDLARDGLVSVVDVEHLNFPPFDKPYNP